jgi:hypothetical protein
MARLTDAERQHGWTDCYNNNIAYTDELPSEGKPNIWFAFTLNVRPMRLKEDEAGRVFITKDETLWSDATDGFIVTVFVQDVKKCHPEVSR